MKQYVMPGGRLRVASAVKSMIFVAVGAVMLSGAEVATAAGGYFVPNKGQVAAPPGARTLCQTYRWACSTGSADRAVSPGEMKVVRQINSHVNRTIRPVDDQKQYGVAERWTMPSRLGGDCEDYALAKKHALIRQGISPQRLLIATVLDRKRNSHAVLVYRSAKGDLVLDNVTNKIRSWQDTRYVFLRMQDPNNPARWVNVFAGG